MPQPPFFTNYQLITSYSGPWDDGFSDRRKSITELEEVDIFVDSLSDSVGL